MRLNIIKLVGQSLAIRQEFGTNYYEYELIFVDNEKDIIHDAVLTKGGVSLLARITGAIIISLDTVIR